MLELRLKRSQAIFQYSFKCLLLLFAEHVNAYEHFAHVEIIDKPTLIQDFLQFLTGEIVPQLIPVGIGKEIGRAPVF